MSESRREKSNKKICFITTVSMTLSSFILPLAVYLHDHTSYDITFICDKDDNFAATLPPYIHYIPVAMKRGINLSGIGAMFRMIRVFRREKFDMVQYSTPNASLYAAMAAWFSGIPIRKYHLMGFRYLGFSGLRKSIFKTIEKLACTLSTDVECVSKSNRELGIAEKLFSARKSNVIMRGSSAGVDLKRFNIQNKHSWREEYRKKLGFSDTDCVFGYVGRITRDKGINELLAAFEKTEIKDKKLLLVGRIESEQTLDKQLLINARNDRRVIFHQPVDDIEHYYSAIDVLILPSYREGFGMVVAEAEAMGIPVIVTDIPGPIDAMIQGKTGLTVKKTDVDSLRSAMEALANSPETRAEFGVAASQFIAENFDQEKLFKAIAKDRERLLKMVD